jgi:hypothetical protein
VVGGLLIRTYDDGQQAFLGRAMLVGNKGLRLHMYVYYTLNLFPLSPIHFMASNTLRISTILH